MGKTGNKSEVVAKPAEELENALKWLVEATGEEETAALSEALFGEGSDISERALEVLPRAVNALVLLARGMAGALSRMDPEKRREVLTSYLSGFDGGELGETVNAVSRMLIRINEEDPRILAEGRKDFYSGLIESIDAGLLRKGITAYADSQTILQEEVVDLVLSDVVLMANLMGILPSAANNLLRLLARAVSTLEFPSEILASATFNILLEIDTELLGEVINGLTATVIDMHEGNLLLGRDEPRLRSVLTHFLEDLLGHLDKEKAAMAVLAMAEDMETLTGVLGDLLYRDPDLLILSTAAALASTHAVMRGATDAVARLAQLPDNALDMLAAEIDESLEPQVSAKLANASLAFFSRLLERKPDLPAKFTAGFASALDTELLGRVALQTITPSIGAALGQAEGFTPDKIGAYLTLGVSAYNQAMERNPRAVKEAVSRALEAVDARELERAASSTLNQAAEAISERPELMRALVRPAASAAWAMFKDYLKKLGGRLKGAPRTTGGGV